MPSKKSAPSKSSPAAKSGSGKSAATKPAAKPAGKSAPAKPAPSKQPAGKSAVGKPAPKAPPPPAKPVAKVDAKGGKPSPTVAPKPGVKPKPIPFTIKNERSSSPFNRAPAAPPKPAPKVDPKTVKPAPPAGPKQRYSVMTADAMAASRAAAAKLAAAAGLHPVKATGNGDAPARNYTRVTKTPFDKKELAEFREMLLVKRRQIEGDVNAMESEALSGGGGGALSHLPQHMADQGTDTFDQSLALDLAASQRGLLKEIDDALARIEAGTYGICEEMGKPIGVERLRHTPWARFCIEAARQHERAAYFR